MDTVKQLADGLMMTTGIEPADMPAIGERGVNTIINLRPDEEAEDQAPSDDIAIAAARQGIDYHHIPIRPGQVEDHHVDSFAAIMEEAGQPVLCSCGSGKRVTAVWALYEAERGDINTVLEQAAACGYDLSNMRERLSARQPRT